MNRPRGKRVTPLTPGKVAKVTKAGRYADGGGLYLWVKPDGRKTWTFRWRDRVTGKLREAGLGSLTNQRVSLKMARERADDYRDQVWRRIDPIEAKQEALKKAREALAAAQKEQETLPTFSDCMTRYIDAHKASWRNEKHTAQWSSTLNTYATTLLDMPVAEIGQDHVLNCLEPIWTTKTETATRVRQRIEAVLDWATVMEYRTGENPARWKAHLDQLLASPTKLKKVQHRAALPYISAGKFMAKLRKVDSLASKALQFQILTASRPGEVTGATWDEINLDTKIWLIPAERMKADKEHEVPLSPQAVKLLKSLPQACEFVFPGPSLKKPITTAAGMKLLKSIETGITQHGFRSTFRDWAADQTSYPREVIEHALAHQLKDKAEASYHRSTVFPKRIKLMDSWSNFCDTIPTEADNVTPINKAKGVQ